jgi:molybdopterin-dependent oxidoreductase alpha subunit
VALKQTLGVGASTVSYDDWLRTDLLVLWGSNLPNNQPVSMKYLYHAKRNGARIAVINPFREPGLERYWIPSIARSALFGTRFADHYFPVRIGGDVAFSNGVLLSLMERNALDERFIAEHTTGFAELKRAVEQLRWPDLEAQSGLSRSEVERFAALYAGVRSAIFIWSMGLTQHPHGVDNVKGVVNLALARGMIGRAHCGVVPIRGHSGVQGGAECGAVPDAFPGGAAITEESAARFSQAWGARVPSWRGMHCGAMLEAAARGDLDVLYLLGGNFLDTMPEPERMRSALGKLPLRIHQDIVFNTSMLVDSGEATLLLPACTRYEQRGGGTQTSTERRLRYSPYIAGHDVGEARSEWEILAEIGRRSLEGPAREAMAFADADQIREEMDRVMPMYRGIAQLKREGDSFQYGGKRLLEGGICPALPEGRARFSILDGPAAEEGQETMMLTTRRGAQFNSIVFEGRDALTGAARDEVLLSREDASRLGVTAGDRVLLRSETGELALRVRIGPAAAGTLHAHWPEANVLIRRQYDPASGEPDYNARVTIEKVAG